jgi:glucokinase
MIGDMGRHSQQLMDGRTIAGIGVAIGGPLDAAAGVVCSPPNLPGWDNVPLRDRLEQRFHLPVAVEHDAAACCLAECRWGAGQNASRVLYLTCGTGFGAGFVLGGQIYRGAGGRNMEIGHLSYRSTGPTAFGKCCSLEAYCAGGSLGGLAAFLYPHRWGATLPTAKDLGMLARAGDPDAQNVLTTNAQAVGDACALLGDLLRPDLILLGSLAQYFGDPWISTVRARFRDEVLPDTAAACRIEPTRLASSLQDCSALVVAIAAAKNLRLPTTQLP